jgi:hypothetical protein
MIISNKSHSWEGSDDFFRGKGAKYFHVKETVEKGYELLIS